MSKALRGGRLVGLVVAVGLSASLMGPLSSPASAGIVEQTLLVTLANTLRATVGAGPLTVDAQLTPVAQAWSNSMAAADDISHNPNLSTQISGWSRMAENVGMGPSIQVVFDALVASPGHYSNLTNPAYTNTGMAVSVNGLTVFVTQIFTRPTGAGAAPVPAVTPVPPPEPNPVVAPPTTVARRVTTPPTTKPAVTTASTTPAVIPQTVAPGMPAGPPTPWVEFVFERLRLLDSAGRDQRRDRR